MTAQVVEYDRPPIGWPAMRSPGVPRLPAKYVPNTPEPKQAAFLSLLVLEALYGGAAGGGKSDALLMAALQFVDVPGYAALLVRKTYQDLTLPGALADRAGDWLRGTGATWNSQTATWSFPTSGRPARVVFGYVRNLADAQRYKSAEFQFIGVDESTQLLLAAYRYLFSRARRPALPCAACRKPVSLEADGTWQHRGAGDCPTPLPNPGRVARLGRAPDGLSILDVPIRVRCATNPGEIGHAWHVQRFGILDPALRAIGDDGHAMREPRVFIPAGLEDNPHLDHDEYERTLREQDPVNWLRLRRGDWTVRDPGEVFDRANVPVLDGPWPRARSIIRVRFWDFASTEAKPGTDPDWTVGLLLARDTTTGLFLIEHVVRERVSPLKVEQLLKSTAAADGRDVTQVAEREPGSAGKLWTDHIRRTVLPGYRFEAIPSTGAKELRIRTVAPIVEAGDLAVVAGTWTNAFLDELDTYAGEHDGVHDDQVDALAGAHTWVTSKRGRLLQ